jgi:hypothetical protein
MNRSVPTDFFDGDMLLDEAETGDDLLISRTWEQL